MRSTAREVVFKYVFSKLFNPDDEGLFTVLAKEAKLNESDFVFANELLGYINDKREIYLNEIENLAIGYKLNRIFGTDRCALLIGMAEIDNYPQTDLPVVIDEAVKLAARFSSERSTDFVNGILAEYAKKTRNGI